MSSAGDGTKPSRSAIVAEMASGHHLLTIHGYSGTKGIPTGECAESLPFTIGGHRWRIDYYPNGKTSEVAQYISLGLILDEDVATAVKAKSSICFAGEEEDAKQVASLASTSVYNFASRSYSPYTTFVKRESLESSNHLRNDSFTIRCDIVVVQGCRAQEHAAAFVSVPPCDLRLHLEELLTTEKGADVVFEVGSETVAAHRCVLAARSSVFSAELFGPMKEGNAASGIVVRVEDMEVEVFKALLHFAYTGSLPEMQKEDEDVTYQHLLVAADRYNMERLKLICEGKLCEYIDVGTVATILALADQHHCEGLKKACFDFIGSPPNLKAVVTTDGFKHLSKSCPSLMIEIVAMSLAS
ncbi:BTB/POZ and MATH domain-containing protein 1-like [Lolium rigidum]|uniref:BTB/POZ and MATH domain-containing protein 1-like n=1 Tax=Lolium rigidum TaxID=89674 RepID=UPI001F5E3467|nr:BTB/POZ and MATH domain-containing protein 1-like [Lolium rigidum]